jgi:alpha-mannosidase
MSAASSNLTSLWLGISTTHLCEVRLPLPNRHELHLTFASAVRCVPKDGDRSLSSLRPPFAVEGARNVFLETVKRGENDDFSADSSTTTVILRLYEAFGGHANVNLRIAGHLDVFKAYTTNFLEDDEDELNIMRAEDVQGQDGALVKLDFRGFEVKTVKLILSHTARFTSQAE